MRRGLFTVKGATVAAPAYVAAGGTGTTILNGAGSVPNPSGIQDGDLMFCQISSTSNTTTITSTPSGWSLVTSIGGGSKSLYLYSKVAGASEPSSASWTAFGNAGARTFAYRNVTGVRTSATSANSSSSSITFATITATAGDMLMLVAAKETNRTVSADTPSDTTERVDGTTSSNFLDLYLADKVPLAGGATGSMSATQTSASTTVSISLALIPA